MIDVEIALSVGDARRRFDLEVSFASAARVIALFGPSGAGKSLTLQAMAGLLTPAHGRIVVDGQRMFDSDTRIDLPAAQRRCGYLFQHYALFPHLSVRDNVGFGLGNWLRRRPAAAAARSVDALLEAFGLASLADSLPRTLSGGQQQRVALARALACEPRVLLLDEPFAALNPMLRGALRDELAAVVRRWNVPAVMITHDVDDVLALADVAFVVEDGHVVRAIDVHAGAGREVVQRQLLPQRPQPAAHPHASRLRALLGAGAHG